MDAGRGRPRTGHVLWVALLACVAFFFGQPAGKQAPDLPSDGLAATGVAPATAPVRALRAFGEVERPPSLTALRRRVRSRTRYDDVLREPRWDSRLASATAGGDPLRAAEALRILRARATLVLSWEGTHRDARSGALHAHSFGCPPPVRI